MYLHVHCTAFYSPATEALINNNNNNTYRIWVTNDDAPIEWPMSHLVKVRKVAPGHGGKRCICSK